MSALFSFTRPARAATTDSAPAPENSRLPVSIATVIKEPPRICTGSTLRPCRVKKPASLATHLVNAITPPFANAYAGPLRDIGLSPIEASAALAETAPPSLPEIELMLTILPPPCAFIVSNTACVHR